MPFKQCGACKERTYCNKMCQILDWKAGGHKKYCQSGGQHAHADIHEPWCAYLDSYLDRDPELDQECLVSTGDIKEHPRELITTGMNTCMFVVIKTKHRMIGWHASAGRGHGKARSMLRLINGDDIVSGFIVPGEDRMERTLDLKPDCRSMRVFPMNDPTASRRQILGLLQEFDWFDKLEVRPPVESYKDFVVLDMSHKRPYVFKNTKMFDEGCVFDGATDMMGSTPMNINGFM